MVANKVLQNSGLYSHSGSLLLSMLRDDRETKGVNSYIRVKRAGVGPLFVWEGSSIYFSKVSEICACLSFNDKLAKMFFYRAAI